MLKFVLPWPPSTNAYYRAIVRTKLVNGKLTHYPAAILSEKARAYKGKVKLAVGFFPVPLSGPVAVSMVLHPPTKRKYDIDNRFKAVLDSLTAAGVWLDDSQVVELQAAKGDIIKSGQVVVRIMEVESG